MAPEEKIWLNKEADRLLTYQHQHRGLSFLKLRLPPTTDRKVNLVGLDNHIYRGSIPKLPEDKLPANVDEKSIDEEAIYKEIRDMNFPPVPPQEPLGPRRRIGGSYTLTKRMTLAPVKVDCGEGLEEIQILGKDGGIYKGVAQHASKLELERPIRGTKRSIQIARQQSSSRGFIEPSLITLQDGRSKPFGKREKSFVELPATNVGKIIELILSQNKMRGKDEITRDKIEPQPTKEKDDSHSEQMEETKDIEENEFEDIESKEESEETESKEESEETESKEESEEAESKEESEETESKEESEDLESKEKSEEEESKEKSEEEESKEKSEEEENKEESEDKENKAESEATEESEI